LEIKNKWAIGGIFVAVGVAFTGLVLWLSPGQPAEQSPQVEQAGQVEVSTTSTTAPNTTGTEAANPGDGGAANGDSGEPAQGEPVAPADRVQPPTDDAAEPAADPEPGEPAVGDPPPTQVPTSTTQVVPHCLGPQDPTPGCIPIQ
jgi:hypothetical protein